MGPFEEALPAVEYKIVRRTGGTAYHNILATKLNLRQALNSHRSKDQYGGSVLKSLYYCNRYLVEQVMVMAPLRDAFQWHAVITALIEPLLAT